MKIKNLLMLVAINIISLMQSCTSDHEPMAAGVSGHEPSISHMVVKFDGKIYETDVKVIGDSVVYLNQEYADVYTSKISVLPELATVMTTENGIRYVEYLPSKKEVEQKYKFLTLQADSVGVVGPATRSNVIDLWGEVEGSIRLAHAELYDDKYYDDTEMIVYSTTKWASRIPYLREYGFNDKCSSLKVFNEMNPNSYYTIFFLNAFGEQKMAQHYGRDLRPVLVCYEDSYFSSSGKVLYCIAPYTGSSDEHSDDNLKSIGWNDKISSIGWLVIYDFSAFYGDNPKIPDHPNC